MQASHIPIRNIAALVACVLLPLALSSCSTQTVTLHYPDEEIVFPESGLAPPRLHIAKVEDRRPGVQRRGQGKFLDITFPSDESWDPAVRDIYRDALSRDIAQTQLAELTPLPSQADYTVEAVIHSFHCRMTRSGASYLLPPAVGMLGGFVWGDDTSARLKRGAVLGVVALGAMPMPLHVTAEAEVELVLRDGRGEKVWSEVCIGQVEDDRGVPTVSRPDKSLAERYMPQAVKRCNACLLGQMRQFLSSTRSRLER